MNSSTSRYAEKKQTQEEIKRQIALLQACLEPELEEPLVLKSPKSPKRKTIEAVTLAPATPSPSQYKCNMCFDPLLNIQPEKKRKLDHNSTAQPLPRPVFHTAPQQNASHRTGSNVKAATDLYFKPPPSKLLTKLAKMNNINVDPTVMEPLPRSTGFTEKPQRDDRLAVINDLEPGPYEHSPPFDDPKFDKLEPHSGMNLMSVASQSHHCSLL
jgi:minichromosome maintenance protein 10